MGKEAGVGVTFGYVSNGAMRRMEKRLEVDKLAIEVDKLAIWVVK